MIFNSATEGLTTEQRKMLEFLIQYDGYALSGKDNKGPKPYNIGYLMGISDNNFFRSFEVNMVQFEKEYNCGYVDGREDKKWINKLKI